MSLKTGDITQIHSYKHSGSIHRIWDKTKIIHSDEEVIICLNENTKVIESNGYYWNTKEPAICFFFKKKWYNIIGMLKKEGVSYYCNIASPFVQDNEAIKYIDYDLDIRVQSDFSFEILDRDEYNRHSQRMNYSDDLKKIVEVELEKLISHIESREEPFNHDLVKKLYQANK